MNLVQENSNDGTLSRNPGSSICNELSYGSNTDDSSVDFEKELKGSDNSSDKLSEKW